METKRIFIFIVFLSSFHRDAIPVWGICHQKIGKNVILYDRTGGKTCIRCFHLTLRSPNVIQVYTEGLDKCYTRVESAVATCPSLEDIRSRKAREIMLYKSKSFTQSGLIDRVFCPINGRFRFSYNVNDGTESTMECPDQTSEISNCPKGSQLHLRFSRCSFGDLEMGLQCLGNWKDYNGQNYMALWDPEVSTDSQPRYRCAMYQIDESNGRVFVSFSVDATCTEFLLSPWDGYETMVLDPFTPPAPPAPVHLNACIFPEWAQGKWQRIWVRGNELSFQDSLSDKTLEAMCLSQHGLKNDRYALYSRTQCGEEEFTCVWLKQRSMNVIELQFASYPMGRYNGTALCSDDMFRGQEWMTQGRLNPVQQASCPIAGEYTGVIPDAKELCAELSSDCENPLRMHYTVSSCLNDTEVYEAPAGTKTALETESEIAMSLNTPSIDKIILKERNKRSSLINYKISKDDLNSEGSFTVISQKIKHKQKPVRQQVYVFPFTKEESDEVPIASAQKQTLPEGIDESTSGSYSNEGKPFYFLSKEDSPWKSLRNADTLIIVEERDYECLGQWEEGGVMYTFTHRRDVNTYECFAGVVVSSSEIFIIEAGTNCQRGLQPLPYGMKLSRKASCEQLRARTSSTTTTTQKALPSSHLPPWWPTTKSPPRLKKSTTTQKPSWKNERPKAEATSGCGTVANSSLFSLILVAVGLVPRWS